ncbi:MAG: hypothetical protein DHS20C16_34920 [Phycisphaerae bacterium]|nr:MAG: hypothetical protein DHS20C16_34920 [Phycisphaerae bacterium]
MSAEEILELRERAKELRCLYQVHGIVSQRGEAPVQTFLHVLEAIPQGWQRPQSTGARIVYLGRSFVGPGYSSSGQSLKETIRLHGVDVGVIEVSDTSVDGESPAFLEGERELLRNIAHRLGDYLEWKHTELLGDGGASDSVHWRWRDAYAAALAAGLDRDRFGVCGVYVGGSTENGNAGHGSDIDLYIHFEGTDSQRDQLNHWLEGWSLCLAELAHQQTGYHFPGGILNIQWIKSAPNTRLHPDLRELPSGTSAGS